MHEEFVATEGFNCGFAFKFFFSDLVCLVCNCCRHRRRRGIPQVDHHGVDGCLPPLLNAVTIQVVAATSRLSLPFQDGSTCVLLLWVQHPA